MDSVDPVARRYFQAGLERKWRGEDPAALALFDAAVARDGFFVAAHRQRQNLLLADWRRGALLEQYGRLRRAHPDHAGVLYLHARLASDPGRQGAGFVAATRLDPSQPWPLLGLGQLAMARGEQEAALGLFERGLGLDPDHRELLLGRAQALIGLQRWQEARAILRDFERLARDDERRLHLDAELRRLEPGGEGHSVALLARALVAAPRHEGHAQRLRLHLRELGTRSESAWVARLLAPEQHVDNPWLLRALMAAAEGAGDLDLALDCAARLPGLSLDEHRRRRLLLARQGRWQELVEHDALRFAAIEELGHPSEPFVRLRALVARVDFEGATLEEWVGLAETLRELGFTEEAAVAMRRTKAPPSSRAFALDLDLQQQLRLEAELHAQVGERYRQYDRLGEHLDFDEFCSELGALSERALGRPLIPRSQRLDFQPIGVLLDPDPATGGPWAEYFAERGRLVVTGQRAFHPPELLLLSAIVTGRAGPQDAYLAFSEGSIVPGFLQHRGAPIAGAALHHFVYVDVGIAAAGYAALEDRLAEQRRRRPDLLSDPVLPAAGEDERRSLAEPAEVVSKLQWRAWQDWCRRGRPGGAHGFLAEAIDEVLVHETAHLHDAQEFLSGGLPWLRAVPILFSHGFSLARIEGWLEMRAQCAAVAGARNPYLALASCVEHLPRGRGGDTPHARGYERLARRFVALIDEEPERYAQVDPRFNLLQQLDRLSAEQIRELGRRVAKELDLPGLPKPTVSGQTGASAAARQPPSPDREERS